MTSDPMNEILRAPEERRGETRFALKVAVSTRLPSKTRVPGRMLDVSRTGCRLLTHRPIDAGTGFWLMIGNIAPRFAHVVWSCDRFAGARFAIDLDEETLASLVSAHSPLSEADVRELRTLSERCAALTRIAERGTSERMAALARDCDAEVLAFDERQRRDRVERLLSRLSSAAS